MIEYQINPTKRLILKTVAILLTVTFVWYDISWAADLSYSSLGYTYQRAPASDLGKNPDKGSKQAKEITNYDLLSSEMKKSGARKFLPSGPESDQSQQFAPGYIQSQQSKHEEIIRQKQDNQDMLMSLDDRLKRKLKKEDEGLDLKKKRGGAEGGGRLGSGSGLGEGEDADYSLTDPDDQESLDDQASPHNLNDFINPSNLNQVNKYDITMMDVQRWMSANPKQGKGENGGR